MDEKKEVIELKWIKEPSSSSSDISDSDWAVIEEDACLEWNTESKYHFRQTVPKTNELSNETSDEDSIELINENDDENLLGSRLEELDTCSINNETQVSTEPQYGEHISETILSRKADPSEVNPLDNWDMIAILMVALIGGIALGYFWGTFTGLQQTHTQTFRLIESKLQFENKLLRHKIRRLSSSISHIAPAVEEGRNSSLLRDLNKLICLDDTLASPQTNSTNVDDTFSSYITTNPSLTLKRSLDQMYNVTSTLEDNAKWNVTETSLSSSTRILKNIERNLEVFGAIEKGNVSPRLQADIANMNLRAMKTSRKVYDKMHRTIDTQAKKNLKRLKELSNKMMKKLCTLKEIIDQEESLDKALMTELLGECKDGEVKKRKKTREIKLDPDCDKKNSSDVPPSGEWILRLGEARETQRQNEHQSDWLFERSQARKSQRGSLKERDDIFKKSKQWFRETFSRAASSTRNAFDQVRRKIKQRNR